MELCFEKLPGAISSVTLRGVLRSRHGEASTHATSNLDCDGFETFAMDFAVLAVLAVFAFQSPAML